MRAVDNSEKSTLERLVTTGLWALGCCQKANTQLHSRRLKPLWILSRLHNVLEADDQEAASNYERQIETGAGGAHYTVTEGSAEFGIGNHLVWASLVLWSSTKSRALLPYISWHQAVWYPGPGPLLLTNRHHSSFGLAGLFLLDILSQSRQVTSAPPVSFDQQPNLLLIFLLTSPRQTVFWSALIIFILNKSRRA